MYEAGKKITIGGRDFELVFNVAALADITERFGGISNLGELLEKDKAKAIREMPWLIALMANQGIALHNEETGEKMALISSDWVALRMKPKELIRQQNIIMEAISEGMNDGDAEGENEQDEVLAEVLSEKNVKGAEG